MVSRCGIVLAKAAIPDIVQVYEAARRNDRRSGSVGTFPGCHEGNYQSPKERSAAESIHEGQDENKKAGHTQGLGDSMQEPEKGEGLTVILVQSILQNFRESGASLEEAIAAVQATEAILPVSGIRSKRSVKIWS